MADFVQDMMKLFIHRTASMERLEDENYFSTGPGTIKIQIPLSDRRYLLEVTLQDCRLEDFDVLDLEKSRILTEIKDIFGELPGKKDLEKDVKCHLKRFRHQYFQCTPFTEPQAQRMAKKIPEKMKCVLDFIWNANPDRAVLRYREKQCWMGLMVSLEETDPKPEGFKAFEGKPLDFIVLRAEPNVVEKRLKEKGYFPSYFLSKKSWYAIPLDDRFSDETILELAEESRQTMLRHPNHFGIWLEDYIRWGQIA